MITRFDPFREALSLRRAMDHLFEQSFVNPSAMPGVPVMIAPMDVCETPNGYEVDIALPGARSEDIELTVDQNSLTVRGRYSQQNEHQQQLESREASQQQGQPQAMQQGGGQQAMQSQQSQQGGMQRHQQGHNWLLREIPSGTFERTITFPRPIDINSVQTKFENGILTVLLPISAESRPKRLSIASGKEQAQQVPVGAGQQR